MTAIDTCHACHGTGWDEAFSSRCNCSRVATTVLTRRTTRAATIDPELLSWLEGQSWSSFAQSIAQQGRKGTLSASQIAAAESMRAKCAQKRTVAPAAQVKEDDPLDLSHVPSGLYAVPGGDTRLKVQIDNVREGKWDGWVFVKDAAVYGEGRRYGSQKPGQYYKGQITDVLRTIAADPMAAAAAYGQLTGTCGRCGRPLEDEGSVARGIGPVCTTKAWRI